MVEFGSRFNIIVSRGYDDWALEVYCRCLFELKDCEYDYESYLGYWIVTFSIRYRRILEGGRESRIGKL